MVKVLAYITAVLFMFMVRGTTRSGANTLYILRGKSVGIMALSDLKFNNSLAT